ncbi:MAG TPA: DUF5723 family protein [bacterium]|jgi:hypothetical protein
MKRLFLLMLILPAALYASGTDWATHVFDHRGPGSALSNPAFLAEETRTAMGIQLAGIAGFGLTASNNSFSVGFWNSHIAGDKFWDRSDTRAILARIPSSGLSLQADFGLPVLGVRYRNFAFNAEALATVHANVPKCVAEIALVGSKLGKNYSLNDLIGESLALSDVSLSYGRIIPQDYLPQLSAGLAFHYYQGFAYTDTRQSTAGFVVTDHLIQGNGSFQNVLATDGRGFGADLGVAAKLSEDGRWKAALAVQRIGATMSWNVKETETAHMRTSMAGLDFDSLDNKEYTDRAFASEDTTIKGGTAKLHLPLTLRASGSYQLFPNLSVAGIVNALTTSSPLGPAGIEAGAATSYSPLRWAAIEGGMLFGGPHSSLFSFGTGLRFRYYELDLNFSSAGGMFTSAHGVGASFSQRFYF